MPHVLFKTSVWVSRRSVGSLRHVILGRKCWQRRENRDSWKPEFRLCEDRLPQASEGAKRGPHRSSSDGGSYLLCGQHLPLADSFLWPHSVWQAQLIIHLKGFFLLFFIFSLEIHLCLSPLGIWFSDCGWSQAKSKQDAFEGSCLEMTAMRTHKTLSRATQPSKAAVLQLELIKKKSFLATPCHSCRDRHLLNTCECDCVRKWNCD